jgi:hypothetical protein
LARRVPSFAIAVDRDLGARSERLLREPAPEEYVGCAPLDRPRLHFAVGLLHVDVNPDVRVHPFDLRDRGLEADRLVGVEFRGKGMMSGEAFGSAGQEETQTEDD